ncbi:DnaB-like helicase C-terminal domain-containing protein [Brucella sp. NBRC 12950]|uniref:DnaB-like helicase C-terminal domain-containing protein n=1 Tax=Brucella sp. NBRC 12950 TaxID=2994518 RepID=UPI0024A2353B|nr:DnaB-like helicase C-terminal domain-containing protein [Brucella sp. NBRC 12950]GLU25533.1 hypothetical protein Brsp01_07660 [Brucella sp. NBRC 12950]
MSDASIDTEQVIKEFTRNSDEIAAQMRAGPRGKTLVTIGEAAEAALVEAEEAMQRGTGITGTTWGLTDINHLTGGMHPGELIIVGARPSMGKTVVGVAVGVNAAKSGAGVGVISLEMSSTRLGVRAATDLAYDWNVKVPYNDLIAGRATKEQLDAIRSANREVSRLPLFIEVRLLLANNGKYEAGDTVAISAVSAVVKKYTAMNARKMLEVLAKANLAPISTPHIRAVEHLMTDPDYADTFEPEDLTAAIVGLGAKADADAKLLAISHKVPHWKALAVTWFKGTKKRRKAA